MDTATRLTDNQADTLSIIEAGRDRGIALESLLREERVNGRTREGVMRTVWSLADRGLVTVRTERPEAISADGKRFARRELKILTATR